MKLIIHYIKTYNSTVAQTVKHETSNATSMGLICMECKNMESLNAMQADLDKSVKCINVKVISESEVFYMY